MPTATFFPSSDGYLGSADATYATARDGTGSQSIDTTNTLASVGQQFDGSFYSTWEAFLAFDTSSLGTSAVPQTATLELYGANDNSVTDFTVEVFRRAWTSGGLTFADFLSASGLSGLVAGNEVATFATSGWSTTGYNLFSDAGIGLAAAVSVTGSTELVVASSRHRAGTTPTGDEFVDLFTVELGTNRPRLTVTYAYANAPETMRTVTSNMRW